MSSPHESRQVIMRGRGGACVSKRGAPTDTTVDRCDRSSVASVHTANQIMDERDMAGSSGTHACVLETPGVVPHARARCGAAGRTSAQGSG